MRLKINHLAAVFLAIACLAHTTVSVPATIQAQLDAMPRGNGLVTGEGRIGGEIHLAAKTIATTQPILLSSGQALIGAGIGATEIVYSGTEAAVQLRSYAGHGYVHLPAVRNLTIRCTQPGAMAVGLHSSARTCESFEGSDLVLIGGGVNLPGEHYFTRLTNVTFRKPTTQPIRFDGQGLLLDSVNVLATAPVPGITAAVEVHGSVTVRGFSRIEGAWGVPLLAVSDWQGHEGLLNLTDACWLEPHLPGDSVRLTHARANVSEMPAAWPNTPWRLVAGSVVNSGVKPDLAGVRVDGTSRLLVGGVQQAVPSVP